MERRVERVIKWTGAEEGDSRDGAQGEPDRRAGEEAFWSIDAHLLSLARSGTEAASREAQG